MASATRAKTSVYLLGSVEPTIIGSMLPSRKQVLKYYIHLHLNQKMTMKEVTAEMVKLVSTFWDRTRIPMQKAQRARQIVMGLHENWIGLKKSKKRRTETQHKQEEDFLQALDRLFNIAHEDAMSMIKITEDREFLRLQRKEVRCGTNSTTPLHVERNNGRRRRRRKNDAWSALRPKSVSWTRPFNSTPALPQVPAVPIAPLFGIAVLERMLTAVLQGRLLSPEPFTDKDMPPHFFERRDDLMAEFSRLLKEQPRDDYRELMELSLIILGKQPPRRLSPSRRTSWFRATSPTVGSALDLQLLKMLVSYPDKAVAMATATVFRCHLWYLSERLVALAFFDDHLAIETKREMFRDVCHAVLLQDPWVGCRFFGSRPNSVARQSGIHRRRSCVKELRTVNDFAELGIALMQDFNLALTKNEEQRQFLLKVVEEHRRKYPKPESPQ
ncbi:hypothetical protein GWK47_004660 [Chionoecetes opilio]|uniref:Uncharacterized protein n=1 Tax=Chionoecetes opilio TaxID=41210 RepID=A0A8J4YMV8_CHIOP|nr:hypothetical protein GWK47_004660 [Chionoecetes opilio]